MRNLNLRNWIVMFGFLIITPLGVLTDQVGCKNIACPRPEPCPSDSYLKLIPKHHLISKNPRSSSDDIPKLDSKVLHQEDAEHTIRKRSTSDDDMLMYYCCPRYECVCKPNYCDYECTLNTISTNETHPTEYKNDLEYGVPGNCCLKCKSSFCMHQTFRKHGDKWRNDDCTTCECYFGEVKCQQSYCNPPDCLSYKQVPGECCPICDNDNFNFCKEIETCNIHCKYGYRKKDNCNLCQCNRNQRNESADVNREGTIDNNLETKDIRTQNANDRKIASYYYSIQFEILTVLSSLIIIAIIIGIIWRYRSKNSAKYTTVQIA